MYAMPQDSFMHNC